MLKILFDGWPLVYEAGSPAALHLLDLLALLPREVTGMLALPAPLAVPQNAAVQLIPQKHAHGARLSWEQIVLPRLAQRLGAAALHLPAYSAPLFSRVPVVISPSAPAALSNGLGPGPSRAGGRLRAAFGRGGAAAAAALLWPDDLPSAGAGGPSLMRLPLAVHPEIYAVQRSSLDSEGGYVAAFGDFEDEPALLNLIETWRWAGPAMGEGWQLRVVCRPSVRLAGFGEQLASLQSAVGLPGLLLPAPVNSPRQVQELLAGAGAALHLGRLTPWGGALPQILAAGCPLAVEDAWGVDARVGPAAYLAPPGDWRTLGAAVLTLLVEENVAEQVSQAARERAAGWSPECFSKRLGEVYAAVRRG